MHPSSIGPDPRRASQARQQRERVKLILLGFIEGDGRRFTDETMT
jgi:hypothetical protein